MLPRAISCAAETMACAPEPQTRLTVSSYLLGAKLRARDCGANRHRTESGSGYILERASKGADRRPNRLRENNRTLRCHGRSPWSNVDVALLQTWRRSGIMPCRALATRLMSSTGALLRPASIALSTWRTTSTGLTFGSVSSPAMAFFANIKPRPRFAPVKTQVNRGLSSVGPAYDHKCVCDDMCAYARFVKSRAKTITAANGRSLVHVPPADSCTRDHAGFSRASTPLACWSGVPDLDGRADPATF
jgi:hypothetical protein